VRSLWAEDRGRTSIQVLNEFYWALTRKLRPAAAAEKAWRDVEMLMRWKPQPLDASLMARARVVEQTCRLSWWDAMIVASAQAQQCTVLLTEDLQHGAVIGGVRIHNPFAAQVQEPTATYRVPSVTRHRPRGRPRKQAAIA
jgi:predicted nucleic acid-binding protein